MCRMRLRLVKSITVSKVKRSKEKRERRDDERTRVRNGKDEDAYERGITRGVDVPDAGVGVHREVQRGDETSVPFSGQPSPHPPLAVPFDCLFAWNSHTGFGTKKMNPGERRKSMSNAANRTMRRQSTYAGGSDMAVIDIEEMEDLGNLSAPVAAKINNLQLENNRLKEKIVKLESETVKNMEEQVFTLKREKTMAQKETVRRKSISQNDGDRMATLSEKVKEQREEIAELEQQLIKAKAEAEGAKSAGAEAAGGATASTEELEAARKELLEANLTISGLKSQADKFDVGALKHINEEMKELIMVRRELEFVGSDFVEMEISFKQLKGLVAKMAEQGAGASAELVKKYRAEVILRKQLYNQVQELRGNIRVFCRCRKDKRVKCALKFPSKTEIILASMAGK